MKLTLADLPPRTPNKRHEKDEESVASSKRDESPVQKKAGVTLQLRSTCQFIHCNCDLQGATRTIDCNRRSVCVSILFGW